jgi:hypothetical protein
MSYESDIAIDETALDVEWVDHPRRMLLYCSNVAEAHKEMDLAKERLDFVKATLDQEIRSMQSGPIGPKQTEASINALIIVHPQYVDASRDYIERKYDHEIAVGAVRAFEHRKTALENLVRLHANQYFAGPAIPHNLSEERQRRINANVRIMRRN